MKRVILSGLVVIALGPGLAHGVGLTTGPVPAGPVDTPARLEAEQRAVSGKILRGRLPIDLPGHRIEIKRAPSPPAAAPSSARMGSLATDRLANELRRTEGVPAATGERSGPLPIFIGFAVLAALAIYGIRVWGKRQDAVLRGLGIRTED